MGYDIVKRIFADLTQAGNHPAIIIGAYEDSRIANDEFIYGTIGNPHTRRGYRRAVDQFLIWCGDIKLNAIEPRQVRTFLDGGREQNV